MAEPLLVARHQSGTARVFEMTDTTLTQIGDDLPASALETDVASESASSNKIINAFGGIYAGFADGVYKLQTGSNFGEWSKNPADGGITYSGTPRISYNIEYGVAGNTPYLFGVYNLNSNTNFRAWRFNLLTNTFEETSTISLTNVSNTTKGSIFYNNTLYVQVLNGGNNTEIIKATLDPLTINRELIQDVGGGTHSDNGTCFDAFQDDLYRLLIIEGTALNRDWALQRFEVGTWSTKISFADTASGGMQSVKGCLFNDDTNLYIIYLDRDTIGWKMFQVDIVGGEPQLGAELTNIVLPSDLRAGGAKVPDRTGRWWPTREQPTAGSYETILYYAEGNTTGDALNRYKFIDASTQLTLEDSSTPEGGGTLALPEGPLGGGGRIYLPTESAMTMYARERVSNGEQITFRAHPPINPDMTSVTSGLTAKFYIDIGGGRTPLTQATLIGSITGGSAVRNGNQIENITADDTDYTVVIDTTGFEDFSRVNLGAELT